MGLEYFVNGPPAFLKKANALVDACRRIPKAGAFMTTHDTPQGPVFNVVPDGVTDETPFAVSIDVKNAKARVNSKGSLLRNYVLSNRQTITGLDSSFNFINGNDFIWLDITIDPTTGLPNAATVNSYGMGGTWGKDDLPGEYGSGHGFFEYQISFDSASNKIFTQYLARIPIFESTTSSVDPFGINNIQMLSSNLIMTGDVYSGDLFTTADGPAVIGVSMPKPFSAPFITT